MRVDKIVQRAIKELDGFQVVNLGIGLPSKMIDYLHDDLDVQIQTENGVLGAWKRASSKTADTSLIDAGGSYITTRPGSAFFDSSVSFAMIRRSKIQLSLMGAFEVDEAGNLANWKIPGSYSPGIGGAMELAQKCGRVVVLCSHNDKRGNPKIVTRSKLPWTAPHCVSRIITDKAVMDVTDAGLVLREISEDIEVEQLIQQTGAELIVSKDLGRF